MRAALDHYIERMDAAPENGSRVEDIPILAEHFVTQFSAQMSKPVTGDAIAQHADQVAFVHRPEVFTPEDDSLRGQAELIVAKRVGQPIDIANMAVFLASDQASYCTGSTHYVDGGWMLTWPPV